MRVFCAIFTSGFANRSFWSWTAGACTAPRFATSWRGKYHLFSEGRLFGFLNKLDRKVTVYVEPRHKGERPQDVVFA